MVRCHIDIGKFFDVEFGVVMPNVGDTIIAEVAGVIRHFEVKSRHFSVGDGSGRSSMKRLHLIVSQLENMPQIMHEPEWWF